MNTSKGPSFTRGGNHRWEAYKTAVATWLRARSNTTWVYCDTKACACLSIAQVMEHFLAVQAPTSITLDTKPTAKGLALRINQYTLYAMQLSQTNHAAWPIGDPKAYMELCSLRDHDKVLTLGTRTAGRIQLGKTTAYWLLDGAHGWVFTDLDGLLYTAAVEHASRTTRRNAARPGHHAKSPVPCYRYNRDPAMSAALGRSLYVFASADPALPLPAVTVLTARTSPRQPTTGSDIHPSRVSVT